MFDLNGRLFSLLGEAGVFGKQTWCVSSSVALVDMAVFFLDDGRWMRGQGYLDELFMHDFGLLES